MAYPPPSSRRSNDKKRYYYGNNPNRRHSSLYPKKTYAKQYTNINNAYGYVSQNSYDDFSNDSVNNVNTGTSSYQSHSPNLQQPDSLPLHNSFRNDNQRPSRYNPSPTITNSGSARVPTSRYNNQEIDIANALTADISEHYNHATYEPTKSRFERTAIPTNNSTSVASSRYNPSYTPQPNKLSQLPQPTNIAQMHHSVRYRPKSTDPSTVANSYNQIASNGSSPNLHYYNQSSPNSFYKRSNKWRSNFYQFQGSTNNANGASHFLDSVENSKVPGIVGDSKMKAADTPFDNKHEGDDDDHTIDIQDTLSPDSNAKAYTSDKPTETLNKKNRSLVHQMNNIDNTKIQNTLNKSSFDSDIRDDLNNTEVSDHFNNDKEVEEKETTEKSNGNIREDSTYTKEGIENEESDYEILYAQPKPVHMHTSSLINSVRQTTREMEEKVKIDHKRINLSRQSNEIESNKNSDYEDRSRDDFDYNFKQNKIIVPKIRKISKDMWTSDSDLLNKLMDVKGDKPVKNNNFNNKENYFVRNLNEADAFTNASELGYPDYQICSDPKLLKTNFNANFDKYLNARQSLPKPLQEPKNCIFPMKENELKLWILKNRSRSSIISKQKYLLKTPIFDLQDYPFLKRNVIQFKTVVRYQLTKLLQDNRNRQLLKHLNSKQEIPAIKNIWLKQCDEFQKISETLRKDEIEFAKQRDKELKEREERTRKEDNARQQTIGSSRRRNRADFVDDTDMENVLAQIDPEYKHYQAAASIPPMIDDPVERYINSFKDVSNIVTDKNKWASRVLYEGEDNFTEREHNLFIEGYLLHPKKFGKISHYMHGMRSAKECVLHYYKTKSIVNYKKLIEEKIQRRKSSIVKRRKKKDKSLDHENPDNVVTVGDSDHKIADDQIKPPKKSEVLKVDEKMLENVKDEDSSITPEKVLDGRILEEKQDVNEKLESETSSERITETPLRSFNDDIVGSSDAKTFQDRISNTTETPAMEVAIQQNVRIKPIQCPQGEVVSTLNQAAAEEKERELTGKINETSNIEHEPSSMKRRIETTDNSDNFKESKKEKIMVSEQAQHFAVSEEGSQVTEVRRSDSQTTETINELHMRQKSNLVEHDDDLVSQEKTPEPHGGNLITSSGEKKFDPNMKKKSKMITEHRTSYWSVKEAHAFPDLLRMFGSQWSLISEKLVTKSTTMVRNYYQRNAAQNNWKSIVDEADFARNAKTGIENESLQNTIVQKGNDQISQIIHLDEKIPPQQQPAIGFFTNPSVQTRTEGEITPTNQSFSEYNNRELFNYSPANSNIPQPTLPSIQFNGLNQSKFGEIVTSDTKSSSNDRVKKSHSNDRVSTSIIPEKVNSLPNYSNTSSMHSSVKYHTSNVSDILNPTSPNSKFDFPSGVSHNRASNIKHVVNHASLNSVSNMEDDSHQHYTPIVPAMEIRTSSISALLNPSTIYQDQPRQFNGILPLSSAHESNTRSEIANSVRVPPLGMVSSGHHNDEYRDNIIITNNTINKNSATNNNGSTNSDVQIMNNSNNIQHLNNNTTIHDNATTKNTNTNTSPLLETINKNNIPDFSHDPLAVLAAVASAPETLASILPTDKGKN